MSYPTYYFQSTEMSPLNSFSIKLLFQSIHIYKYLSQVQKFLCLTDVLRIKWTFMNILETYLAEKILFFPN